MLAERAGVSARTMAKAMAVADRDPALLAQVATPTGPSLETAYQRVVKTEIRERIDSGVEPLPKGTFRCIVADVPWPYDQVYAGHRGSIPYPPMAIDDICAMPVGERAAADCVLVFWTTNAFLLRETAQILAAWGFDDKSVVTWVKPSIGVGNWARGQTEHFVIAVRGKPVVETSVMPTVLEASKGEHSSKPEAFYERMERYCPGPYLELFARRPRDGWTVWGAEVDHV